jgi:hypothetical protein
MPRLRGKAAGGGFVGKGSAWGKSFTTVRLAARKPALSQPGNDGTAPSEAAAFSGKTRVEEGTSAFTAGGLTAPFLPSSSRINFSLFRNSPLILPSRAILIIIACFYYR